MLFKLIIFFITLLSIYHVSSSSANWLKKASLLFILMFAFGYRAINISNEITLHPIDIFLIFFWLRVAVSDFKTSLPIAIYFLLLFAVWGLINGFLSSYSFELVLLEFKGYILIYLIFTFVGVYYNHRLDFNIILLYYTLSISIVCFFGLIEYFFPNLIGFISSLYNIEMSTTLAENTDNFLRANFTNWGAATVGHIILLSIPFVFYLNKYNVKPKFKPLFLIVFLLEIISIYATGNRADWFALILMLLFYLFVYKSFSKRVFIYLILTFLGFSLLPVIAQLLPDSALARFVSGITAIGGAADEAIDSSGFLRQQRIDLAWNILFDNPFGAGFGSSGWVHSDFLQFAANTGWLGGFLFIYFYFNIQISSIRTCKSSFIKVKDRDLLMTLIISNIGVGFNFMINGIYNLPQTAAPYFLLMALNYFVNKRVEENVKYETNVNYEINHITTSL